MGNSSSSGRDLLPTVLISAIVFLAYGIPIVLGWFGFYGDDWIYIINNRTWLDRRASGILSPWDRTAFSAGFYMLTGYLFWRQSASIPFVTAGRTLAGSLACLEDPADPLAGSPPPLIAASGALFRHLSGFQRQPIAVQYILHFASLDLCLFRSLPCSKPGREQNGDRVNRSWFIWNGR